MATAKLTDKERAEVCGYYFKQTKAELATSSVCAANLVLAGMEIPI
jgi:hypothetical protein